MDVDHAIARMPTWLVDLRTRRQFAIQNGALLVPFVQPALQVTGTL